MISAGSFHERWTNGVAWIASTAARMSARRGEGGGAVLEVDRDGLHAGRGNGRRGGRCVEQEPGHERGLTCGPAGPNGVLGHGAES
jgi:hypothetical protein